MTTYTDPRSLDTTYVRNGFGEVIEEVNPDSGTTTYVRDARGLITQKTDARSVVTNYTYDDAGRPLTRTYPAATAENVTFAYDDVTGGNKGKERLTSITDQAGSIANTYDARGNITVQTRTIGSNSYTVSYVYDAADQISEITYPSGRQVKYTRDSMARITKVESRKISTDPWATVTNNIAYQPMSRLIAAMDFANGLDAANTYTQDYELNVLGLNDGATAVIDRSHARTDLLNLTGITDAVTSANSETFSYSTANRLISAVGAYGTKGYSYDGVGNRTQEQTTPSGGSLTTETYNYPSTNNRISDITVGASTVRTFGYDAAGNMTSDVRSGTTYAYTYNKAGRLATVSYAGNLRGTYTYNGNSQLAKRVINDH